MTDENKGVIRQDDAGLADLISGGSDAFVPRLDLLQPSSPAVADDKGKPGEYLFFGEQNLGTAFPVVVGPWRPHALVMDSGQVAAESFDPNSEEFDSIMQESQSGKKTEGRTAMHGVDMLLWLPTIGKFAIFFFKKTARKEAPEFRKIASTPDNPQVGEMYSHKVETTQYKWWVPKVRPWEGDPTTLQLPSKEEIVAAETMFGNPIVAEEAPEDDAGRAR